jgi:hypothetical protein
MLSGSQELLLIGSPGSAPAHPLAVNPQLQAVGQQQPSRLSPGLVWEVPATEAAQHGTQHHTGPVVSNSRAQLQGQADHSDRYSDRYNDRYSDRYSDRHDQLIIRWVVRAGS